MVLPQLTESVLGIVNTFPSNADGLTNWVVNTFKLSNKTAEFINNNIVTNMTNWFMDNLVPSMSEVMSGVSTGLISVLLILKNLLLGLIICIYFLNGKEMFAAQTKKIIFAILKKERAEFVIHESKFINRTFSGFIIGKIVDSIIIGIICFIGLTIMKMPYTLLISVIVGVTNVIPFFGPFIGAIPSTIIILLESPIQALYFVIFIQILQLADGNFIGPKILGDSTGIPSFWVIFAILLGGGLFGFVGMIIGIPIFAVIYAYVGRYVRFKLEQKNLPSDTVNYKDISHYTIKKPSKKGVK
jgi:predicted PurR-regulated permease PerM